MTVYLLFLCFLCFLPLAFSLNPVCLFPQKVGPCEAAFHHFYFNGDTKKCEPFLYGGCQGNPNNFKTLEECSKTCEDSSLGLALGYPSYCYYLPDSGPCSGYYARYYYDYDFNYCFSFLYGGCGGNSNNFVDVQSCIKTCG